MAARFEPKEQPETSSGQLSDELHKRAADHDHADPVPGFRSRCWREVRHQNRKDDPIASRSKSDDHAGNKLCGDHAAGRHDRQVGLRQGAAVKVSSDQQNTDEGQWQGDGALHIERSQRECEALGGQAHDHSNHQTYGSGGNDQPSSGPDLSQLYTRRLTQSGK